MRKAPFAAALCLLALATRAVPEAATATYRVAAFDYYPAIFRADDGKAQGLYVDMLSEIAKREHIAFEYVWGTWNEGLERAKRGEVDLVTSAAWTAERAEYLDYCDIPLLTVWGEVYHRAEEPRHNIAELDGEKIGIVTNDNNGRKFREMAESFGIQCAYVEYSDFASVFEAVKNREVHAGVVSVLFGESSYKRYGLDQTGMAFAPFDIYFAVPKGRQGKLRSTIDGYVSEWKDDPASVYYSARLKWRSGTVAGEMPRWLRYALAVTSALAAVAIAFSWTLRVRVRAMTRELSDSEREVRKRNDFVSLLLDSTSEGIVGISPDGKCSFCNAAFASLLGYRNAADVTGKAARETISVEPPAEPRFGAEPKDILGDPGETKLLVGAKVLRVDGTSFPAEVRSRPMRYDDGSTGAVITVIDIADRVVAQREREAKEVAERSNRAKSDFISKMSHDLRTPLNSVIVLSGVLSRRLIGKIDGDELEYLSVIERNGRNLLDMINEILDLSRIESGQDKPTLERRDVTAIIADCTALVEPQARAKGLDVATEGLSEPLWALIDERMLRRIFQNLFSNAIKYTDQGTITVSVAVADGKASLTVRDTGIGIESDFLPRVFDRFSQADTGGAAAMRQGGVGLGLEIAKRHAESLGGEISVTSSPGLGTAFTVTLPLEGFQENRTGGTVHDDTTPDAAESRGRPEQGENRDRPEAAAVAGEQKRSKGRKSRTEGARARLLVVDDNADNRLSATALLGEKYDVRCASNGVEGTLFAAIDRPDAILLDIAMPGMNGFETLKLIRSNRASADIPVIAVSSSAMAGDRESILASGFDAYVPKPIETESLIGAIEELLR